MSESPKSYVLTPVAAKVPSEEGKCTFKKVAIVAAGAVCLAGAFFWGMNQGSSSDSSNAASASAPLVNSTIKAAAASQMTWDSCDPTLAKPCLDSSSVCCIGPLDVSESKYTCRPNSNTWCSIYYSASSAATSSTSSESTAASGSSAFPVSTDGTCGTGATPFSCPSAMPCCSQYNWCGKGDAWCSKGNKAAYNFGSTNSGSGSTTSASSTSTSTTSSASAKVPIWETCNNPTTDICADSSYTCCVAPADKSSKKFTCRPNNSNECAIYPNSASSSSTPSTPATTSTSSSLTDCQIVQQSFPSLNIPDGCNYNGIAMNGNGHVTGIFFDNLGLRTLSPLLGQLGGHLTSLTLRYNNFGNAIPSSYGNFVNVGIFDFHQSGLTGSLPESLCNLVKVTEFDVQDNAITGSIPSCFSNFQNPTDLYFQNNRMSGSLPASLGSLKSLNNFYINGNSFSGDIPSSYGNLNLNDWYSYGNLLSASSCSVIHARDVRMC